MEPKVKERITGAAVLVALGVWLIPWVLDGPEAPGAGASADPEPSIMLPSAADSAPIRTETVELTPREPDSRSGAADSESDQAESAPAQVAVVVSGAPEAGREQGVADDAPSAASAATASPRTAERASGSPTAANADATTQLANGWWVQLGAFGEAANAAQLVSRVATYGYTARVFELTSGGRVMHRVRVGAFASENEAEAAASALSAHNFTVDVIRPE